MVYPTSTEVRSAYRVNDAASFKHKHCPTQSPEDTPSDAKLDDMLSTLRRELDEQQRILYANATRAVLIIFQGMDASGKDGTIRAVFRRIDPAGLRVTAFGAPSTEENKHDFLWRTCHDLPRRGHIAVYNRSYYEDVLIARIHPEFLQAQKLQDAHDVDAMMKHRLQSIADHEKHLARSGTIVIKFWLHHSQDEQRKRLMARLTDPNKFWKFTPEDIREREYWPQYMDAYQNAICATHQPWAPWYVIPSDHKSYQRVAVAKIVRDTLIPFTQSYPSISKEQREGIEQMRKKLASQE